MSSTRRYRTGEPLAVSVVSWPAPWTRQPLGPGGAVRAGEQPDATRVVVRGDTGRPPLRRVCRREAGVQDDAADGDRSAEVHGELLTRLAGLHCVQAVLPSSSTALRCPSPLVASTWLSHRRCRRGRSRRRARPSRPTRTSPAIRRAACSRRSSHPARCRPRLLVVLVVSDQHDAAVGVAEGDRHDLAVPAGRAVGRAGDAYRARVDEAGQVAERVVLGVARDGVLGADGDDAGAGVAAAVVGATVGSRARFQLTTVCDQLRVTPMTRLRVCHFRVSEKYFAGGSLAPCEPEHSVNHSPCPGRRRAAWSGPAGHRRSSGRRCRRSRAGRDGRGGR